MATRPARGWDITNHAVDRYRERAIACCERQRTDRQLRSAIAAQLDWFASHYTKGMIRLIRCGPWRMSGRHKPVCEHPTHAFVVVDGVVVTTLGYGMSISEAASKHYARTAKTWRQERYAEAVARRGWLRRMPVPTHGANGS